MNHLYINLYVWFSVLFLVLTFLSRYNKLFSHIKWVRITFFTTLVILFFGGVLLLNAQRNAADKHTLDLISFTSPLEPNVKYVKQLHDLELQQKFKVLNQHLKDISYNLHYLSMACLFNICAIFGLLLGPKKKEENKGKIVD